jgi:hypothetical protein
MDAFTIFGTLLSFIPFALIALIVYLAVNFSKPNFSLLRNTIIITTILSALFSGVTAFYYFPTEVLGSTEGSLSFGIRVAFGVAVIISGLFLRNGIQKYFLLVFGLILLALQAPYIFDNFGTLGALFVVIMAFVALTGVTVWLTMRPKHE